MSNGRRSPHRIIVVGAGMVGLSTAWFLLRRGVDVVVLERREVAAGASWGNAGWVAPAHSVPLPDPSTLRAGLTGFMSPSAPLYVPATIDLHLVRFLTGFLRNATTRRWRAGLAAMTPLNLRAFEAFDELTDGGVPAETLPAAPLVAAPNRSGLRGMIEEMRHVREAGLSVEYDLLDGIDAHAAEPALSDEIGAAMRLRGQRRIDPGDFVAGLAQGVRKLGGHIAEDSPVSQLRERRGRVEARIPGGVVRGDAVVIANGGLLNRLAAPFGVSMPVQAGRGYSFSVRTDYMPTDPVMFPAARVVAGPMGDRMRIAGMMEFRRTDARLDPGRIASVRDAAAPQLRGVAWPSQQDDWVGARPCTPDGLPLIGPTLSPKVFVAGGHGMWGITLGPITGQLLAETIATGRPQAELAAVHPLR